MIPGWLSPVHRRAETGARPLERGLVLAAVAAFLSRMPSLVPRSRQDQTLITTGGGLLGAAAGLAAEGAIAVVRRPAGGRGRALAILTTLAAGGLAWSRRRRTVVQSAVATASEVTLTSITGGEVALAVYELLPRQQRSTLVRRAGATAIAAASAISALRRALAEPRDLMKASIRYDYLGSVSGGLGSRLPVDSLDREGRKFLANAVPAPRIAEVMEEEAIDPIRVYAGLDCATEPAERARLAVEELERLGAFERPRIVFYCPTGAGFVNPVAVEAEELLSRGDVASVVVQYGNKRALRAFKDLSRARETWQRMLETLVEAIDGLQLDRRPELAVYGESLGAWVVAEALAEGGPETLTRLHIGRGALVGVPYPARVKLRRIRDSGVLLPDGIGVFDSADELRALPREAQEQLRYVLLTHPEDPIGLFSGTRLLWERPEWLEPGQRHPRVPSKMRWIPGITYVQMLFDVKNGTGGSTLFQNYAHDYRVDAPELLRVAFGHGDVSDRQLEAIEEEVVLSAERQARREARARVGPARA
ncbi:MAG: hypothetical protein E6G36_10310 [Actinobacteria bacterium]|nr:MAG: hypothetical protein E6G36_10310 [Actinomycetota bacterium]